MKKQLPYYFTLLIVVCNLMPEMLQAQYGISDKTNSPGSLITNSLRPVHPGNGSGVFGQTYVVENLCGLNYVSASTLTETRTQPSKININGTGFPAKVTISGLPAGFVVQEAYVYEGVSYTEAAPATTLTITNPGSAVNTYNAVMIGDGPNDCWTATGTCGYRTDVTAAISGNGAYTINVGGFANAANEVNGVTLFITYVDPTATYSGNIAMWDGDMVTSSGSMSFTGNGFTACTNSSMAKAFSLQGDMQEGVNKNQNSDTYNGNTATFHNDFWQLNVIPTSVTASCANSCAYSGYTNNSGNDCWMWTMAGLYWQYSSCTSCSNMKVTSNDINPSCGNNNGSITLNVTGGTAPYNYTWTPAVSTTTFATGLAPGSYQVVVKDVNCNVQTISVALVMVNLNVTITKANIQCNGQKNGTITLSASGGDPPYHYTWKPNVSSDSLATGLSAGAYTVAIADVNGCTQRDTISIIEPAVLSAPVAPVNVSCNGEANGTATANPAGGTPPYTYSWSNGTDLNPATNFSAGTYTLVVKDSNGCHLSPTVTITEPALLAVVLTGPQIICSGQKGTLNAKVSGGTPPYAYNWSTGSTSSTATFIPTSTETYTCAIIDANNCPAMSTITIQLGPPLTVSIFGPATTCSGIPVSLCGNVSGGTGGNTFTWQPGNISDSCISASPDTATVYSLTVMDNCGAIATAMATLRVNPLPLVNFNANIYQGCSPFCVQFKDLSSLASGNNVSWKWIFGNGDSALAENPIYCYPNAGIFSVNLTVVSDSGCSSTLKILNMITVFSHPEASFSVSPQPTTILSPTIQFTNNTIDQYGIAYWFWKFGDTNYISSTKESPSHTYPDTGTYCPRLVVMNIRGCTDTLTNCLVIDPIFNLYIPSAFTPNGDGKNEIFQPIGLYVKSFEMYIYDRWGTQLYHTLDIYSGWNGRVNGGSTVCQEDTYVYKIYVTDSKDKTHTYVGDVSLLK